MPIINPFYPPLHFRTHYLKHEEDFEQITTVRRYADGGASMNEQGDIPVLTWELEYFFDTDIPGDKALLAIFDAHYKAMRISRSFPFTENNSNVVEFAYYKRFVKYHVGHKQWEQYRRITIIEYPVIGSLTDNLEPSVPANFGVSPHPETPDTAVNFTWVPSFDNEGIEGYEIWLDGAVYNVGLLAPDQITGIITYPFGSLQPGTSHSAKVRAYDFSGLRGQYSDPVPFTTTSTAGLPTTPTGMTLLESPPGALKVTWNPSAD